MAQLFYETIHAVNCRDYTVEQLNAWAPSPPEPLVWGQSFAGRDAWAAVCQGVPVGFADMDPSGYLDRLYVHKDFQGHGIATALCDLLEMRTTASVLTVYASITARPFFLRRGYQVVHLNTVERHGVQLQNFLMEKRL